MCPAKVMPEKRRVKIHMGPQHPSTHGVLHLVLTLHGERISKVECEVGFLHRGMEKIAENLQYQQFLPYPERLDYLSGLVHPMALCLTVEKMMDIEVPKRAAYIRVILAELSRIASHLLWLATHALDIGAMTVFMYAFREREAILNIFEMVTGGRMTFNYFRFGGCKQDVPAGFVERVNQFIYDFPSRMQDYETLLTNNRIWLLRTRDIGHLSAEDAINYGVTGSTLRGSGVDYDVRKEFPYSCYEEFDVEVPLSDRCDTYGRYLVRLEEMRQSLRIIKQACQNLPEGDIIADDPRVKLPKKEEAFNNMETMIRYCCSVMEGFSPPAGETYMSVEAPKGELGYYLVSDGSPKPYRLKIRVPSLLNLAPLDLMSRGHLIADIVAIIGTLDIVLGDVDK